MKTTLRISFEGKSYDVLVEVLGEEAGPLLTPVPITSASPVALAAARPRAASAAGAKEVVSPLAGKVMAVEVQPGSAVRVGQPLVTLEAMKMNTTITAQAAGVVAAVHVGPGDTVEEGQPLLALQ